MSRRWFISSWRQVAFTGWLQWPKSSAGSLTLTASGLLGLDNPQWPLPQGVEAPGTGASRHVCFLSDIPLGILHPKLLDASNTTNFLPQSAALPPSKASLAPPPDCLTDAPDKHTSRRISAGNEAQPSGWLWILEKDRDTYKVLWWKLRGRIWVKQERGGQQITRHRGQNPEAEYQGPTWQFQNILNIRLKKILIWGFQIKKKYYG